MFALWLGVGAICFWAGGKSIWFLWLAWTALMMWGTYNRRMALRDAVVCRSVSPSRVREDEAVVVTVSVTLSRRYPLTWIALTESWRKEGGQIADRRVTIPAERGTATWSYALERLPRGVYASPDVRIDADDGLSGIGASRVVRDPIQFAVWPAPWPVPIPRVSAAVAERTPSTEIRALRDYALGDPLTAIDWKASSRGTGWKSKVFEPDAMPGTVYALLSLEHDSPAHLDLSASVMAALVPESGRIARRFAYVRPDGLLCREPSDILDALSQAAIGDDPEWTGVTQDLTASAASMLACVVSRLSPAMFEAAASWLDRGGDAVVYRLRTDGETAPADDDRFDRLENRGCAVIEVPVRQPAREEGRYAG